MIDIRFVHLVSPQFRTGTRKTPGAHRVAFHKKNIKTVVKTVAGNCTMALGDQRNEVVESVLFRDLVVNVSSFEVNKGTTFGGAVFAGINSKFSLTQTDFKNNTARDNQNC